MFVVWFWNRISCPFHLTERSWWTFSLIHCSPFSCCIPCRYWRTPWWFCCPCSPCRFCCDYASCVFFIILIDTIWSCGSKSKSGCWGTGVFLLEDSKIFILIRCDITHMQLWRHNEGTYDKKFNLILNEYLQCAKFQFFPWCGVRDRGLKFFHFPNIAATPRDVWRHNYDFNILHE